MHTRDDAWKNIVAAAVGGLAASWIMNRFQSLQSAAVNKLTDEIKRRQISVGERAIEMGQRSVVGGEARASEQSRQEQASSEEQEPTTLKVAEIISIKVARHKLNEREKKIAEPVVHYTFGVLMGAWYGVLSELTPLATRGRGSLYGAAVWLGADEIGLSALGLSGSPLKYPLSSHLSALSAHAVYGVALDSVRLGMLKIMGASTDRHEWRKTA